MASDKKTLTDAAMVQAFTKLVEALRDLNPEDRSRLIRAVAVLYGIDLFDGGRRG